MNTDTILLVDDDKAVAEVISEMLTQFGYKVLKYTNSLEALKRVDTNAADIDLIITDFTMPDLTGIELTAKIAKIRSDIPIILMTGYGDQTIANLPAHKNIFKVLKKPVKINVLGKIITDALGK